MKPHRPTAATALRLQARRRRGSVLILVLALLSILLVLATTLSFTSRLEMAATENFARGVQGRFAAVGGLAVGAALFNENPEITHFMEPWAHVTPEQSDTPLEADSPSTAITSRSSLSQATPSVFQSGHFPMSSQGAQIFSSLQEAGQSLRSTPADLSTPSATDDESQQAMTSGSSTPAGTLRQRLPGIGLVDLMITDESACLDLNLITEWRESSDSVVADSPAQLDFEMFLETALSEQGLPTNQARALTRSIALWRYGADAQPGRAGVDDDGDSRGLQSASTDDLPASNDLEDEVIWADLDGRDNDGDGVVDEYGEGIDEPDEFQSDPRLEPVGDDRVYERVRDLMLVPGMTPEIYAAIAPMLTVHSVSWTTVPGDDGETPLIDVNRASHREILNQLREHFPNRPDGLLEQFALNIIDARDADSVPSRPPGSELDYPPLGVERTPLINEVWPDSETAARDGDDGQYIELINAYPEEYDLTGHSVRTALHSVSLSGTMPPNSHLIITDDFDETEDSEPEDDVPNYGSLFEMFPILPNGTTRLLVVDPQLEIPDTAGVIEFLNPDGELLDWFEYRTPGSEAGRRRSFQRNDPRVRHSELALCSPFETNSNASPTDLFVDVYADAMPQNRSFATPADLMMVFSGWEDAPSDESRGWVFPAIHSSDSWTIDSRIVDIFSVGPLVAMDDSEDSADEETASASSDTEESTELPTEGGEWAIGRINVNTAPRPVLRALPGVDEDLAQRILDWRAQMELTWMDDPSLASPPFVLRGDLLRNESLWDGVSLKERLATFRQFVNVISTSSSSCRVEATAANVDGQRTPSTSPRSVVATLMTRDGRLEVVSLEFPRRGR